MVAGFYSKLLGDTNKSKAFWNHPKRLEEPPKMTPKEMENWHYLKIHLEEVLEVIKNGEYKKEYYIEERTNRIIWALWGALFLNLALIVLAIYFRSKVKKKQNQHMEFTGTTPAD